MLENHTENQSIKAEISPPAQEPGAWLRLATVAEENENWQKAGVYLDSFLGSRTPSNSWLKRRIHVAEKGESLQECVSFQDTLLDREPDNLNLRIDFCDNLQRLGRGNEGVMHMEYEVHGDLNRETALRVILLLHERDQRWLNAAMTAERLASDTSLEDFRLLFQRASRLRQKSCDMQGAVKDMELALQGIDLSASEERLLSQLKALESGAIQNVDDAIVILRRHENSDFRFRAISYLAQDRFPLDSEIFAEVLSDLDPRVIRVAIQELSRRGGPKYVVKYIPFSAHQDRKIRMDALRALGRQGGMAELPVVLQALDPEDREVFRVARKSLEEMSGHVIGLSLDPSLEERQELAAAWRGWILAGQP